MYYQLAARGYIHNNLRAYKGLVSLLTRAHELGIIDWAAFEDRARRIVGEFDTFDPTEYDPETIARRQVAKAFQPCAYEAGR